MTESIDLTNAYRDHYRAQAKPAIVHVPARPYLMIDGEGDPNTSPVYQDAVAALYPIAYGIRKVIKDSTGTAYKVMPLEGLWWVEDMAEFSVEDKSDWQWTMMICQPEEVTLPMASDVIATVTATKKLAVGDRVRLERFGDGKAAQILHKGAYADEAPTIAALHEFIRDQGLRFRGKHHEIYLTDPRKGDPANNHTIIRQPVDR